MRPIPGFTGTKSIVVTEGPAYKKVLLARFPFPLVLYTLQSSIPLVHNSRFRLKENNIIIKMQFSRALIALVAAGLASAQLPNVPSCSVRDTSLSW